jgi:lantibiotic biosynthesis protein
MSDYASSGFFVLRAPLLPIEDFLRLCSPPPASRAGARARLREWLDRPATQEALWLASPDLLESLAPWRDNPESAKGRKLERALYRYFARMTARATPFGAFAACALGEVAGETRLELAARQHCRRRTRLDMEYLFHLAEAIALDPALRGRLVFHPNDTLRMAAGRYHHLRRQRREGESVYHLIATEPSPAIAATLRRCAGGATAHDLAAALLADVPGATLAEAEEFMGALIESQVLAPALMPPVAGVEPVEHMISQLDQAQLPELAAELRALATAVRDLDAGGLGADLRAYGAVAGRASRLPAGFQPGRLVQVDVFRPVAVATLDQGLVDEILRAIDVLHSIQASTGQPALQAFQEEFALRYRDREVPLLEALDDEAGIGFESDDNAGFEPLLAGIDFQAAAHEPSAGRAADGPLLRRLEQLAENREGILHLDPQLLRELAASRPLPLPASFGALGSCFLHPDGKPGFHLQYVFGPSGANLMARFCGAGDPLAERVQNHLRAEEGLYGADTLFAEIVHLPEGRVGNVVCRPVLRQYEIPFLTTSGVPPGRQLPLHDLTLSLRGGRIVLRSRRFQREVMPRLTSAHDFTAPRNLKLYKFLGLLQQQGVTAGLSWDWGTLSGADFLPRVVFGNVILSPACWNIGEHAARALRDVEKWRRANSVPRFAAIVEGDHSLLLDFEIPLSVDVFLDHIGRHSRTVLVEMLPAPGDLPARGPDGAYVHEIVLPFVRRRLAAAPQTTTAEAPGALAARQAGSDFVLTSDWLYAKLYCSHSHADRLLLEMVKPLVREALACGSADRWFFIRYADPRWHLRLRIRGDPAALISRVLPSLRRRAAEHQERGTLWRLEFDGYEPEIDRYGGPPAVPWAERLFQVDSELCLELLELTSGDEGAQLRWQLALCAVNRLLSALGLSIEEKKTLAGEMARVQRQEFFADEAYKRQVARKFRDHRNILERLLQIAGDESDLLPGAAIAALSRFSSRLIPIHNRFEELRHAGQLTRTVPELASSFAHMQFNRLFRSRHHEQEAVAYELLSRSYASAFARSFSPEPG